MYLESLHHARRIESDYLIGMALCGIGLVALAQDDADAARAAFIEAAGLLLSVYSRDGLADILYGVAALALRAGDAGEAAVLLGAADATRERIGYFLSAKLDPTFDAIASGAHAALGDGAFERAYATGMAMGTREAVVRAMTRSAGRPVSEPIGDESDGPVPIPEPNEPA
jgi:hypothetical protein